MFSLVFFPPLFAFLSCWKFPLSVFDCSFLLKKGDNEILTRSVFVKDLSTDMFHLESDFQIPVC